ncbi:hypothetical protein SPB21_11140 [Leptothoe sp. ISB3NOV94-8A]
MSKLVPSLQRRAAIGFRGLGSRGCIWFAAWQWDDPSGSMSGGEPGFE